MWSMPIVAVAMKRTLLFASKQAVTFVTLRTNRMSVSISALAVMLCPAIVWTSPMEEKHSSTKERLLFYSELYKKIFKIAGKPKSILDLGCGINPLSFVFMNLEKVNYHAYDINKDEIKLIDSFFKILNKKNKEIKAIAQVKDITKLKFPKTDIAFLFKITDILDKGKGHKKTEEIIKKIPAKHIIISFPTLTMSGKKMTAPRRKWMEWMCKRLRYEYQILEYSNELFYVIEKRMTTPK